MRACASCKKDIIGSVDNVFDLTLAELEALLIEKDPVYLGATSQKHAIRIKAEQQWRLASTPCELSNAAQYFTRAAADIRSLIEMQLNATSYEPARRQYEKELKLLEARRQEIEDIAPSGQAPVPCLNLS
jgi:hypothetical protein